MIGIVMLLISGLSTTNGIREVLQRDFISGSINIMNSILGAAGIACGTALAMLLLDGVAAEGYIPVSYTHLDVYKRQACPCYKVMLRQYEG